MSTDELRRRWSCAAGSAFNQCSSWRFWRWGHRQQHHSQFHPSIPPPWLCPQPCRLWGCQTVLGTALSHLSTWLELPGGFSGHHLGLVLLHKGYWSQWHALCQGSGQIKPHPCPSSAELRGWSLPQHINTMLILTVTTLAFVTTTWLSPWSLSQATGSELCTGTLLLVLHGGGGWASVWVNTVCSERRQESFWCWAHLTSAATHTPPLPFPLALAPCCWSSNTTSTGHGVYGSAKGAAA